jgi:hypothetical protein
VRPEIVVQVAFIEWTVHGKLRIPDCSAFRIDKTARDVVRSARDHASGQGAVPRRASRKGSWPYYEAIAPVDGADIRRRPVTMERYPNGLGRKGFIQKDVSKGFPEWLERVTVPKKGGVVHYPLVTDARSLLWTVNQNSITPHVWISRAPALTKPDLCVFDLDPSKDEPDVLRRVVLNLRDLLVELKLTAWVHASGSKGFTSSPRAVGARREAPGPGGPHLALARSQAPHPRVQQGRPRRTHLRGRRAQQSRCDLRGRLRRARQAGRARVRAVHVGGNRARQSRPADVHSAGDGAPHEGRR